MGVNSNFNDRMHGILRERDPEVVVPRDWEMLNTVVKDLVMDDSPYIEAMKQEMGDVFSFDPDASSAFNQQQSAMVFEQFLGIDKDQAEQLARTGTQRHFVDKMTDERSYVHALKDSATNAYHNFALGTLWTAAYLLGDDELMKQAHHHAGQRKDIWESYGFLGDTFLMSLQPASTQLRYAATHGLAYSLPMSLISFFNPKAKVANFLEKAFRLFSLGANFSMIGFSQAGTDFYEYSQMVDEDGNKIDLENPAAKTLFWISGLTKGLIETTAIEKLPWVQNWKKAMTPGMLDRVMYQSMQQTISTAGRNIGKAVLAGPPIEATKEFFYSLQTNMTRNALIELENAQGASFDRVSTTEMVEQAVEAFIDGGRSMVIPALLGGASGSGALSYRARTEASKAGYQATEDSAAIDRGHVLVTPRDVVNAQQEQFFDSEAEKHRQSQQETQQEAQEETQQETAKPKEAEKTPIDPVRGVLIGEVFVPLSQSEINKVLEGDSRGAKGVEVIIEGQISSEGNQSADLVHQASLALQAKVGREAGKDILVFNNQEELTAAVDELFKMATVVNERQDSETGDTVVTIRDLLDGTLTEVTMTANPREGMEVFEADFGQYKEYTPQERAALTKENYFKYAERQNIRKAIGDLLKHTKGKGHMSMRAMENNVDAVILVADALGIATNELLNNNLVFKLETESTRAGKPVSGWFNQEDGVSVIHLTPQANETTLIHELGHFLRRFATDEQLAPFVSLYGGKSGAMWSTDVQVVTVDGKEKYKLGDEIFDTTQEVRDRVSENEERFANDFMTYLATGKAPNEQVAGIFDRMKSVLKKLIEAMGFNLDPQVKKAFDDLLFGGKPAMRAFNQAQARKQLDPELYQELTSPERGNSTYLSQLPKSAQNLINEIASQFKMESFNTDLYQQADIDLHRRVNEEIQEIHSKYQGTSEWLTAPNGEISKLNSYQWAVVRTKAFKEWFGDWENDPKNSSKVLDENGEPLVVYHGTTRAFSDFGKGVPNIDNDLGAGHYFSNSWLDAGENYSQVDSPDLSLRIQNLTLKIWDEMEQDPEAFGIRENDFYRVGLDEARKYATEQLFGGHSNVMPMFLNMKNPAIIEPHRFKAEIEGTYIEGVVNEDLDLVDGKLYDFMNQLNDYYEELSITGNANVISDFYEHILSMEDHDSDNKVRVSIQSLYEFVKNDSSMQDAINEDGQYIALEVFRRAIEAVGFDGFIDTTVSSKFLMANLEFEDTHFIAFNDTAMKSATGNRGTFNPLDSEVLMQEVPQFQRWFENSKVVDESGNPLAVYRADNSPIFYRDIETAKENLVEGRSLFGAYAHMENPATYEAIIQAAEEAGWSNPEGELEATLLSDIDIVHRLSTKGYDGWMDESGSVFAVFHQKNIRSISNPTRGEFPSFDLYQLNDLLGLLHKAKTQYSYASHITENTWFEGKIDKDKKIVSGTLYDLLELLDFSFMQLDKKEANPDAEYVDLGSFMLLESAEIFESMISAMPYAKIDGDTVSAKIGDIYDFIHMNDTFKDVQDNDGNLITGDLFYKVLDNYIGLKGIPKGDFEYIVKENAEAGKHGKTRIQNINKGVPLEAVKKRINTEGFKNWFGESKAVDRNGNPKVLYHGTRYVFDAFDISASIEEGFFFTPEAKIASQYAIFTGGDESNNIMPVFLSMQNPKIYDDAGNSYNYDIMCDRINDAKAHDHDGLIIRNMSDMGGIQDQYVVFRPEQIKSVIGNTGKYDPTDYRIHHQEVSSTALERMKTYHPDNAMDFYQLTQGHINYARSNMFLDSYGEEMVARLESLTKIDKRIRKAIMKNEYGQALAKTMSQTEVNKVLAKDPELVKEIRSHEDFFGVSVLTEDGLLKTSPIELRTAQKASGPTKGVDYQKFQNFMRTISQAYFDAMPNHRFEQFRGQMVAAIEHAYQNMDKIPDSVLSKKGINSLFNKHFIADLHNQKAPPEHLSQIFEIAPILKKANKTIAALNFNTYCPMFVIGSRGCYIDGCYVTGMGCSGCAVNYYARGMYTGEILQLSDEVIAELNKTGGLRLNGMGDINEALEGQMRDVIRHAAMRGLKLKIITKQEATFKILQNLRNSGDELLVQGVDSAIVQATADPYWVSLRSDIFHDDARLNEADYRMIYEQMRNDFGLEGSDTAFDPVKLENASAIQKLALAYVRGKVEGFSDKYSERISEQSIIDAYRQMAMDAKIINGEIYRKYGFSLERLQRLATEYPDVKVQIRTVVGTPKEIAEYALKAPWILQTWMHAQIEAEMYSDAEGRILEPGAIGNFKANIKIEQIDGEWRIRAARKPKSPGQDAIIVPETSKDAQPYIQVERYIKENYSEQEQDYIFRVLAGQLEGNPSALCCAVGATAYECHDCTSSCHAGSYLKGESLAIMAGKAQNDVFLDKSLNEARDDQSNLIAELAEEGMTPQDLQPYDSRYERYLENEDVIERGHALNSPDMVFDQLSKDEREALLEVRKEDIKTAVKQRYWVSTETLEEYAGESWADQELRFRKQLTAFPWALEQARGFDTLEDFLEFIQEQEHEMTWEMQEDGQTIEVPMDHAFKRLSEADHEWYSRVFAYSKIRSPQEMDRMFIEKWTSTDENMIELGRMLRAYRDVGVTTKNRRKPKDVLIWHWGTFKGVSTLVKRLTEKSTKEEIQRAREKVLENPKAYRQAMREVMDAFDRVLMFQGLADRSFEASRDRYYELLGEEVHDSLTEPLALNQMTDREVAERLRESKDRVERFNARERLATPKGVRALEQQANAELKKLKQSNLKDITKITKQLETAKNQRAETSKALKEAKKELRKIKSLYDKERARAWKLVENLHEKTQQAKKVKQLEKDLQGRRERVEELRELATQRGKEVRRLERIVDTFRRREENRKLAQRIAKLQAQIKRETRFRESTMDASYEELFRFINTLDPKTRRKEELKEQQSLEMELEKEKFLKGRPEPWVKNVDHLKNYVSDGIFNLLKERVPFDQWTVAQMEELAVGVKQLGRDARLILAKKREDRSSRKQEYEYQYYRQMFGHEPNITPEGRSISNQILAEIRKQEGQYKESEGKRLWNIQKLWWAKMQRIARIVDGNREGVVYDLAVRQAHYNQQEEFRQADARIESGKAKREELKITDKHLMQKIFSYTLPSGMEVNLSRDEVMGLYIFMKNEISRKKLLDQTKGNQLTIEFVNEAISKLSKNDIAWADWLLQEIGGDEVWARMAQKFYEVYNGRLGRRENYFTFESMNKETEGNTDTLVGPEGRPVSYTDKGMTKEVNENAIYPLRLDVTNIWERQVRRQEHFMAWAEWVRDMHRLLGKHSSLGELITHQHGKEFRRAISEYVNDMARPNVHLSDVEHVANKLISNAAAGVLAYNIMPIMRQLGSLPQFARGDISVAGLFQATAELASMSQNKKVMDWINSVAPELKHRTFNIDIQRLQETKMATDVGRMVKKASQVGMQGIRMVDQAVVYTLWYSAYKTYVSKNMQSYVEQYGQENALDILQKDAVYRASQLIAETQPVTNPTDLNAAQRLRSPWVRSMIMFTNQLFQLSNQLFLDVPYYIKNRDIRRTVGSLVAIAANVAIMMAVGGVFIKRDDEDNEEYLRKILFHTMMEGSRLIPVAGNTLSESISGWQSRGGLVNIFGEAGTMVNALSSGNPDRINRQLWSLITEFAKISGAPTVAMKRMWDAFSEQNPLYLMNRQWAEFYEERYR